MELQFHMINDQKCPIFQFIVTKHEKDFISIENIFKTETNSCQLLSELISKYEKIISSICLFYQVEKVTEKLKKEDSSGFLRLINWRFRALKALQKISLINAEIMKTIVFGNVQYIEDFNKCKNDICDHNLKEIKIDDGNHINNEKERRNDIIKSYHFDTKSSLRFIYSGLPGNGKRK